MTTNKDWFRLYHDILDNSKFQSLTEADQRRFVMLLCLRCKGVISPSDLDIAESLGIVLESWLATKDRLISLGLIDRSNFIINWATRQEEDLFSWINEDSEDVDEPKASKKSLNVLAEQVYDLFNEIMPDSVPRPRKLSDTIKKHITARCREDKERVDLDWWREYFQTIAASNFLTGQTETEFTVSLIWVIGPKNMEKILSGMYKNKPRIYSPEPKNFRAIKDWVGNAR